MATDPRQLSTKTQTVTANMAYLSGNSGTEMIVQMDPVSTCDPPLLHVCHLPTAEQHEIHDQLSTAAMTTPQAELSRSYVSEDLVTGDETSSYIEYTQTMESHCFPDNDISCYNSVTWRHHASNDSVLTQNRTLNSTPELPVCESSDLLDIPFASHFDLLDFQDSVVKTSAMEVFRESMHTTSPKLSVCSETPRIKALKQSMKRMPTSCTDSPARHSGFKLTALVNSQVRSNNYGCGEVLLLPGMLDEPIAVHPHSKSVAKSLEGVSDSGDENNNSHLKATDVDVELEGEPGDDTHDQNLHRNSEDKFQYHPERSSIFRTDTKFNTLPLSSEGTGTVPFSLSSESSFLSSAIGESLQQTDKSEHKMQPKTLTNENFRNTDRRLDRASRNPSCSECEQSDTPHHSAANQSESKTPLSYRNTSWSYHTLPDTQQNTPASKRERGSLNNDRYITVRAKTPLTATRQLEDAETASAAKCRRGNDTPDTTVSSSNHQARSVKQRLPFKSPLKPTFVDHYHHTTGSDGLETAAYALSSAGSTLYMACSGKRKPGLQSSKQIHCSSEVRLSKRKLLADQGVRRKPLAGLAIAGHGNYNVPAESTSCFRMSLQKDSDICEMPQDTFLFSQDSDTCEMSQDTFVSSQDSDICEMSQDTFLASQDSDTCETSQDTFVPSHKDKLHRGINNCYFTGAKQSRDKVILRKVPVSKSYKDHERVYILRDPATNDILERKVEGAENLPPSLVFPMKRQTGTLFRTVAHDQRQQNKSHNKKVSKQTRGRMIGVSMRKLDRSSDFRTHSKKLNKYSRETSPDYHTQCISRHTTESTKTSTLESHRTHPIACSTLIRDYSENSDAENMTTWTLSEKSCFCNFQKSNFCSTQVNSKLHAAPVFEGTGISKSSLEYQPNGKAFEISSMVSQIDKKLNHYRLISNSEIGNMRKDTRSSIFQRPKLSQVIEDAFSDYSFSAAQSPSQTKRTSHSRESLQFMDTQERSCSASASEQTTTSSIASKQATVSISCRQSEENNSSEPNQWSHECKRSGLTSSEGSLTDSESCSDNDDLASTPTSEYHPGMYNKHNTSSDSLCSAARCRPRHSNQQPKKNLSSECSSQTSKNILSSILTDSPESVNPSGILAPDNSSNTHHDWPGPDNSSNTHHDWPGPDNSSNTQYDWPGLFDCYSNANTNTLPDLQIFCPGLPTHYLMFNPTVANPFPYYMSSTNVKNYSDFTAECQTKATSNIGICYPPHTALSDAKFIATQQSSVNHQSQTTSSVVSTSTSVSKDDLNNKSNLVMPACVATDPYKIKNKHSLGHKLRKFRNNVYKKTKKLTHLHICE